MFQWLRFHTANAGGPGSIPSGGNRALWTKSSQAATKILHAVTRRPKILCAATKTQLSRTKKFLRRQLLTSIPTILSVKSKAPFMKVKVVQSCPTLQPHRLHSPWNSPGQNTGVGSLSVLQGIFPTQGLNPGLLHCRQILYQLSHEGSPRIPEWVAFPFSRGSFQPRNWTRVSCIASGFFINWAIREAQSTFHSHLEFWGIKSL